MCSDLDPDPYLKGHGHTRQLKVRGGMAQWVARLTRNVGTRPPFIP